MEKAVQGPRRNTGNLADASEGSAQKAFLQKLLPGSMEHPGSDIGIQVYLL